MPPKPTPRTEYIETETGNKISRRASILGPRHIILAGKCVIQHDCILHGDLIKPTLPKPSTTTSSDTKPTTTSETTTSIHLGRYVHLSPSCILHPPSRLSSSGTLTHYPLRIADNVFIGASTVIRAASIASNVTIGANCSIGNMVIIKENCRILDGTVLVANSVWSAGSVVAGKPGRVVGEVGEGWGEKTSGLAEKEGDEIVGVRGRERWAGVGNKRV